MVCRIALLAWATGDETRHLTLPQTLGYFHLSLFNSCSHMRAVSQRLLHRILQCLIEVSFRDGPQTSQIPVLDHTHTICDERLPIILPTSSGAICSGQIVRKNDKVISKPCRGRNQQSLRPRVTNRRCQSMTFGVLEVM